MRVQCSVDHWKWHFCLFITFYNIKTNSVWFSNIHLIIKWTKIKSLCCRWRPFHFLLFKVRPSEFSDKTVPFSSIGCAHFCLHTIIRQSLDRKPKVNRRIICNYVSNIIRKSPIHIRKYVIDLDWIWYDGSIQNFV